MSDDEDKELDKCRKQMKRGLNEEDLYRFFCDRVREQWMISNKNGKLRKQDLYVMCREAWRNIPLITLEGLVTAFKIKLDMQAKIARANKSLEDFKKKYGIQATTCDKCKSTNCDGKCSGHKKKETKATKDEKRNKKEDSSKSRKKRKASSGKDCGKNPDKKNGGKSSEKKSEEKNNKRQGKDDGNRQRDVKRKKSESAKTVCKKKKMGSKPPSRSSSDDSKSEGDDSECESDAPSCETSNPSGYESSSSERGNTDNGSDDDSD